MTTNRALNTSNIGAIGLRRRGTTHPRRLGASRWIGSIAPWLVTLAIAAPIVDVIYESFRKQTGLLSSEFSLGSYESLFTPDIARSVGLSFLFGLGGALVSVIVGGVFAWLVVRTNIPARRFLELATLVPFFLSSFILAIAWEYAASPSVGLLNTLFHTTVLDIYTPFGIILVIGIAHIPLAYLSIAGALRQIDSSLEQAARVAGAGPLRTGLQVTARLASPAIISSFIITFVLGFEDLGVPLILGAPNGINPLAVKIWQAIQSVFPANYNFAAAASVLMMVIPFVAFWLQQRILRRRSRYTVGGKATAPQRVDLGRGKWVALGLCLLWILFAVVLPIVTLILCAFQRRWTGSVDPSLFTLDNFVGVFHNDTSSMPVLPALTNSVVLSAVTATIVIILAVFGTYGVNRLRAVGGRFADLVMSLPLAIPGATIAVGLLNLLIQTPLYATIWIIGIAYAIRYFPYALRPVDAALGSIHPELEEASRVSGRGLFHTLRLVIAPLLRPALVSGWLILFVMFMREVAMSNLLYAGGNQTLSVALRSVAALQVNGVVAAFTLMQVALFLVVAGVALLLSGDRRNLFRV